MSFKKIIANGFSAAFHPLSMPLIGFVLAVTHDHYLVASRSVYQSIVSILLINTFVPMLMILLMIKYKMISGIDVRNRKERFIPYLIVIGFYSFSYFLFQKMDLPISNLLYSYFLGVVFILSLGLIINVKWKISVHLLALGGLLGWMLSLSLLHRLNLDIILFILLIIAGVTAFARLYLRAHTSAQVYVGFVLGFVVELLVVYNRFYIDLF